VKEHCLFITIELTAKGLVKFNAFFFFLLLLFFVYYILDLVELMMIDVEISFGSFSFFFSDLFSSTKKIIQGNLSLSLKKICSTFGYKNYLVK
jgi:hypothetical protein